MKRDKREKLSAMIVSFMVSVLFMFNSPLHPCRVGESATDSSVFKAVALMMERGYLPYKDTFDHKGPCIYLINYLGNKISYYTGVWILEVLGFAIVVYAMYKIARLSCSVFSSWLTILIATSLMFEYFEGGNLTEEYAMPCIAISIYIFLDYLLNDNITKIRLILAGFCLGFVLMLRPNMIAVWIIFSIYIFIKGILSKEYAKLASLVGWFILGICLIDGPIIMWFIAKGDLLWFWKDYIVFNGTYISDAKDTLLKSRFLSFRKFAGSPIFLLSFAGLFLSSLSSKKAGRAHEINMVYALFMVFASGLVALSGREYAHYGMVLIPVVSYPLSLLFGEIEKFSKKANKSVCAIVFYTYLACMLFLPYWLLTAAKYMPTISEAGGRREIENNGVLCSVIKCVEENTDVDEKISVYGNWDIVYVLTKRTHATQYSYLPAVNDAGDIFEKDYFEQLRQEQPRIIVVQKNNYNDSILNFLNENKYTNIYKEDENDLQSAGVYCLRNETE